MRIIMYKEKLNQNHKQEITKKPPTLTDKRLLNSFVFLLRG